MNSDQRPRRISGVGSTQDQKLADLEARLEDARNFGRDASGQGSLAAVHPTCSPAYAEACAQEDVQVLFVPEWGTHLLTRAGSGAGNVRHATGLQPYASLDPGCDLPGGLQRLRDAGICAVTLVNDPLWCPSMATLQKAFGACRPLKENFFIDRSLGNLSFRKRHRNRINNARKRCEAQPIRLAEHLDRWWELYSAHVQTRAIAQPFSRAYFERLARLPELETIAVLHAGEIATMTLWLRFANVLYYHDAATSQAGLQAFSSYAAFAYVIEHYTDYRFVFFGGASDFQGSSSDGLAEFKRGFANASVFNYICNSLLRRPAAAPSSGATRPASP